jgi:hypothetical protein
LIAVLVDERTEEPLRRRIAGKEGQGAIGGIAVIRSVFDLVMLSEGGTADSAFRAAARQPE